MSDYLGPNQTRVLSDEGRNFESIVYQMRKPPLSSEVNLEGKINETHNQQSMQYLIPSGWSVVGNVVDSLPAVSCSAGTIICDPAYAANTIKLVGLDQGLDAHRNVAWVNGMRVLVQGCNSTDEDNLVTLAAPGGQARVDFVYLEVWRKLIDPTDTVIYKHGNVQYGGTNFTNDLVDPAIGIETSRRIQVQYAIRTVSGVNYSAYPEGFDDGTEVTAQGPNNSPSNSSQGIFTAVAGDPGLWRAGQGDEASKTALGTVDGYVYAIPIALVNRRNINTFNGGNQTGSGKTRADYLAGTPSDRPDNLYQDIIASTDIVDLRHLVIPQENMSELCENAFDKLLFNTLPNSVIKNNQTTMGYDNFILGSNLKFSNSVPIEFLECRDYYNVQIAMMDTSVSVRSLPDGTAYLWNKGGNITDPYDFGHQMEYHLSALGGNVITIPQVIGGYTVIGIVSVYVKSTTYPNGRLQPFPAITITRDGNNYTINTTDASIIGSDITVMLYLANKFFGASKQGRIITDCWQMMEMPATMVDSTTYHIDSTSILALGSYRVDDPAYPSTPTNPGVGYVYDGNTCVQIATTNRQYPNSDGTIKFNSAPSNPGAISVPVLLSSSISGADSFTIYYKTNQYQGLLDTSAVGVVEAVGKAITTTAGSGSVADFTYSVGTVSVSSNSNIVSGSGSPNWDLVGIKAGMVMVFDSYPTKEYKIKRVLNNQIHLNVIPDVTPITTITYTIKWKDHSQVEQTNIIDRLPTLSEISDTSALGGNIQTALSDSYPILETRIISKIQDIATLPMNSFWVGENDAFRGRYTIGISPEYAPQGASTLGLKFEKLTASGTYKKTYQSYIFNKDNSGRLYLMVVGSESDNLSGSCYFDQNIGNDSVDFFELPGRPLVMRRIA
jgi:hypothetical protein